MPPPASPGRGSEAPCPAHVISEALEALERGGSEAPQGGLGASCRVGGEEALGPRGCAGTLSCGRWQGQAGRVSPWGWDGRHLTPGSRSRRVRVGGQRWRGSGREQGVGPGPIWLGSEVAWVLCPLVKLPGEPQGPSWPAAFLPGRRGWPESGSLVALPASRRALPRPCPLWCLDSVLPS